MEFSLSIVIPNRNRNLITVKRTLDSLITQTCTASSVVMIDYGSSITYQRQLSTLFIEYPSFELILCPTQGQLWNKSRCINIALRQCTTSHFMVADVDLLFHHDFIKDLKQEQSLAHTLYFPVGVLEEEESKKSKKFEDYNIKFTTTEEATGISVFPTDRLMSINGFDEYYHGWGSEDTDVHIRLRNANYNVFFKERSLYFLHQWHPKDYRTKDSTLPFHSTLEKINFHYLHLVRDYKLITANIASQWGEQCKDSDYKDLNNVTTTIHLSAVREEIIAFIQLLTNKSLAGCIKITVTKHPEVASKKVKIKTIVGLRTPNFITLEAVNTIFLETIVSQFRNHPYTYSFDRSENEIALVLKLS